MAYIVSKNSYITGEDKKLSADIISWLKSSQKQEIFPYLFSRGHRYSMYFQKVVRDYSETVVQDFREKNYFSVNTPAYRRVGVGIDLGKDGFLTIVAVYSG